MSVFLRIKFWLQNVGFNTHTFLCFFRGLPLFLFEFKAFKKKIKNSSDFKKIKIWPILEDRFKSGGTSSGHYFHQDLLIAQRIFRRNPKRHLDVGSRVDGFVAHVASFRKIEVIDIRPLPNVIENINFVQADLLKVSEGLYYQYDSVSCLHALEHIGLGRYGDPIDPLGHIKAIEQLHKLLEPAGTLYLSVPIGSQRVEFNAQRVFSIDYLLSLFKSKFTLNSFSYVDDSGALYKDFNLTSDLISSNCKCNFGCGIFELTKI